MTVGILVPPCASADEWHIIARAGVGNAFIFNSHFDSSAILPKPAYARLTDDDESSVSFISIAAGWKPLSSPLRLEAEISHWGSINWQEGYSISSPGFGGQFSIEQSASITTGTLSIYYDQPVSESFIIFAGTGLGAGRVETQSQRGLGAWKALDVQPVATFSLGGVYSWSERWGLEIRGTTTTSLALDFEPQTRGWTHNKADISLSAGSIGVRRYF